MSSTKTSNSKTRASLIIGANIVSSSGEVIAKIADIIIDRSEGRVAFAVLERVGVLTAVDNYYRIPWSRIDQSLESENVTLSLDEEQLSELPSAPSLYELID